MSTMQDLYDDIEWNPEHDGSTSSILDYEEEKRPRRKHSDTMKEKWMEHIYDAIALCTLAAVLATLFKLLVN